MSSYSFMPLEMLHYQVASFSTKLLFLLTIRNLSMKQQFCRHGSHHWTHFLIFHMIYYIPVLNTLCWLWIGCFLLSSDWSVQLICKLILLQLMLSERHLCEALLIWLSDNRRSSQCSSDDSKFDILRKVKCKDLLILIQK